MYPVTRKDNLHVEQLPNETVIYDRLNHQAHCLNRTVFTIWESADGTKSVDQLAAVLTEKFGVPLSRDLVLFSLNELKKVNLLQSPAKLASEEELPSRRQIGRKLALAGASAALLPFVASLVAPTPAMARSYNPTTYAKDWAAVKSEASQRLGTGSFEQESLPNRLHHGSGRRHSGNCCHPPGQDRHRTKRFSSRGIRIQRNVECAGITAVIKSVLVKLLRNGSQTPQDFRAATRHVFSEL